MSAVFSRKASSHQTSKQKERRVCGQLSCQWDCFDPCAVKITFDCALGFKSHQSRWGMNNHLLEKCHFLRVDNCLVQSNKPKFLFSVLFYQPLILCCLANGWVVNLHFRIARKCRNFQWGVGLTEKFLITRTPNPRKFRNF